MESFGQYLRTEREKRGIRLEEISSITKIQLHHLNQLEKSAWDELPPEPFIRGFILAYAKYVGLSGPEVLGKYQQETQPLLDETPQDNAQPSVPEELADSPTARLAESYEPADQKNPIKIAFQFGFGILFVGLAIYLISLGKQSSETGETVAKVAAPAVEVQPQPEVAQVATNSEPPKPIAEVVPATNITTTTAPTAETAATKIPAPIVESAKIQPPVEPVIPAAPHEITVVAKAKSWMKVVIDDNPPKEQILQMGEKNTFSAQNKIKVVLGYAPGADVTYNGAVVKGNKFSGTIHYFIYPPNARFPQDIPKRTVAEDLKKDLPEINNENTNPSETESKND